MNADFDQGYVPGPGNQSEQRLDKEEDLLLSPSVSIRLLGCVNVYYTMTAVPLTATINMPSRITS